MVAGSIALRRGCMVVDLDRRGAVISGFRLRRPDGTTVPVLRGSAAYDGDPLQASCFPLVPFGNRVRDNRFGFDGHEFTLIPNQAFDRHYLHGDGWLACWTIMAETATEVTFRMRHAAGPASPYAYAAEIRYSLADDGLSVKLTVRNEARHALPFGLGLHPYFPLTPLTTLRADAQGMFSEEAEYLPGALGAVPDALDFSDARRPPREWINNGFTGWSGRAEIVWPEHQLALTITAGAAFRDYVLFMSDTDFEPDFAQDHFCFEPMTHHADAHHAADLGGLVVLDPGNSLSGQVTFQPHDHAPPAGTTR